MHFEKIITTVIVSCSLLYAQGVVDNNMTNRSQLDIATKSLNTMIKAIESEMKLVINDKNSGKNKKILPLSLFDIEMYKSNLKEEEAKLVSLQFDLTAIKYLVKTYKNTKKDQNKEYLDSTYDHIENICSKLNQRLKDKKLIKQSDNETVFLHSFDGEYIKFILDKNFRDPKNRVLIREVR